MEGVTRPAAPPGAVFPLGCAALGFALGVTALQLQPQLPAWGSAGLLACLLLCLPLCGPWRLFMVFAAALALGFGWAAWRAEIRLADVLPEHWEGRDVAVVGVVAGLPQGFSRGERFAFDVERVETAGAVVPRRVMLSWYRGADPEASAAPPSIRAGERWHLVLRLRRPHGNANPGGFDYEAWLLENGVRATGYVRPREANGLVEAFVPGFGYGVERLRQAVRDRFLAVLPPETHPYGGILAALAVGDQRAIQGDLWNVFNRTGTTHLMSISGLHVTLVAALAGWACGALWRRVPRLANRVAAQRVALAAGVLAAFLYTALAGFGVPAQRTLYMLAVAALALGSGRWVSPGRVLGLALVAVLLADPWAVLAAGFWLSFGAVAALLFVAGERRGAEAGEGDGPGRPPWGERLRAWGLVQGAATLASLPVLLLVFGQFSLVSPLANALASPVVSFVVTPLALAAAAVPWDGLLHLAHLPLAWLMEGLALAAVLPVWQSAAPPLSVAILAGLGVILLLLPAGVPGRWAGLGLLLPLFLWPPPRPAAGEAWVTVLDVGQGLSTVVRTRDHTLVYDPGPLYSAESDAGQRVVVPYLRSLGVDRLDGLVVTHRDSDHSGGSASLRAALPVDSFWSSAGEAGSIPCQDGQRWEWDDVRFTVLHPAAAEYRAEGKANHLSCTLRIEAGGRAILLTSDIEARDEEALLRRHRAELAVDVVLVPHHGSRTSSTPAFVAATAARHAVVPVGYRNRFGHPKEEVLARYAAAGMTVWRTDRDGAVELVLARDGVKARAWRSERPRYWHGR